MMDFKEEINSDTIIVGDFKNPFNGYPPDKKNQQGNSVLKQHTRWMDLIDIYRTFSSQSSRIYILFKCIWNSLKDRPHIRT